MFILAHLIWKRKETDFHKDMSNQLYLGVPHFRSYGIIPYRRIHDLQVRAGGALVRLPDRLEGKRAMDLQYYQFFLEIARCRSISKAADRLFISQPYLSKVLSRLEQEMGAKLVDRSSLPICLTTEGECLVHYAQQILELDMRLHDEISRPREESAPLIIGTPPFLETHVMPKALTSLTRIYPHTRFQLVSAPLAELMQQLRAGSIHAVFALQHPIMGGAPAIPVVQDRVLLALPPTHRLYRPQWAGQVCQPWFPLSELSGDNFVMSPPGSITRKNNDQILSSLHIRPHVVMETGNPEALFQLSVSGHGISLTPETRASDMPHYELPNYITLDHALTYHTLVVAYYHSRPHIKSLVDVLQELYFQRHLPAADQT